MADTTLSLPSLAVLLALSFLAVRYLFLTPSSSARTPPPSASAAAARARPVDPAKIEQVARMFPQLERRAIAWDLARNGGSVNATAERVLERGGLERPPPSYNPPGLGNEGSSAAGAGSPAAATGAAAPQDLIARYGLTGRLGQEPELPEKAKNKERAWATTKTERAASLARRRDDMILRARRDMEERVRRETEAKAKMVS